MARMIAVLVGLVISLALSIAGFTLAGSGQENQFYTGAAFGLAAVLIFSISINSLVRRTKPGTGSSKNKATEDK